MNQSEIAEKAKFEQFMRDIADKRFQSYRSIDGFVFTSESSGLLWACWERAIAESQAPRPPHVTMQMLIDAGLNAFGLQLFCESFANIPQKPTDLDTPFSFIFRGLTFTVARTGGEEIDTRHH